jgi:hypothetical protein
VVYDKAGWHEDSALRAGQPVENAFAHIGLYLAWAIRRGLHDPAMFDPEHVALVQRGAMTGSDLESHVDGVLAADMLSAEGRAFTGARYQAYLDAYAVVFADWSDYAVVDDAKSYALIAPVIDRLHATWVSEGRPSPPPEPEEDTAPVGVASPPSAADFESVVAQVAASMGARVESPPEAEHVAPQLEALLPADLTPPPMMVQSTRASSWGSSLLNRSLGQLRVAPHDAIVVTAIGGRGADAVAVTLYSIPKIEAALLYEVLRAAIPRPPQTLWVERNIDGRVVSFAGDDAMTAAFWATDGLALHVAGSAAAVANARRRLPR